MYTIHFLHKKLIITTKATPDFASARVIECSDLENLTIECIYNFFKSNSQENTLVLITAYMEEMLNHLGKYFKTLNASGGLVVNPWGDLLMIFRNGKWDLPKGLIEAGETPEVAAKREIAEETGIYGLSLLFPLAQTYHAYEMDGLWHLKKTYWFMFATESNQTPVSQQNEGIEKAIWAKPVLLKKLLRNTFETIRQVMAAAGYKNSIT